MKKLLKILVICVVLLLCATVCYANDTDGANLYVNGKKVKSENSVIFDSEYGVLIPLRTLFEELGETVTWNPDNTVTFSVRNAEALCYFDSWPNCLKITLNGKEEFNFRTAQTNYVNLNNRYYFIFDEKLKVVLETFGYEISADFDKRDIFVTDKYAKLFETYSAGKLYFRGDMCEEKSILFFDDGFYIDVDCVLKKMKAVYDTPDTETWLNGTNFNFTYQNNNYIVEYARSIVGFSCDYCFAVFDSNANEFVQLHQMGVTGWCRIVEGKIYFHEESAEYFLRNLDFKLKIDSANKTVYI